MPEAWVYFFGGILIGMLLLTLGYRLLYSSVVYSQKQDAMNQFDDLVSSVRRICLSEVESSESFHLSLPEYVRVIFATSEEKIPLKVYQRIKNREMSNGRRICLQFKDEDFLRCYPEDGMECNIRMPYLGVLPEKEDIFVAVSRILGKGRRKDYEILILKKDWNEVELILR